VNFLGFKTGHVLFKHKPHDTVVGVRPDDGSQLDLHWKFDPVGNWLPWDFNGLIQPPSTITLGNVEVPVLSPQRQFAYLCVHGAKHAWFRLKWLADVVRILPTLSDGDLCKVRDQAKRDGTWAMIATSLQLVENTYGYPLPAVLRREVLANTHPSMLAYMQKAMTASPLDLASVRIKDLVRVSLAFRHRLSLRTDLSYKLNAVTRRLADVRDIQTLGLPRRWIWIYVLLGPFLAIGRVLAREIEARVARRPKGRSSAQ